MKPETMFNFRIERKLLQEVKAECARRGISMAFTIRRLLTAWLKGER